MGVVYLVGAGPGDPDLLTVRAARLLRRADVIVHDALVSQRALERVPRRALLIDVGKRAGRPSAPQEEINRLLIDWSRRVQIVVRLKGGDPFVFGRGGEEAIALAAAGVRFEVVPGVTAALAAAAYAGIPLTHRGVSSGISIVTGSHAAESPADGSCVVPIVVNQKTVVCYMPVGQLGTIVDSLLEAGHGATTPAALVEYASYPQQRTICAPLGRLVQTVGRTEFSGPVILIVGDVVALRQYVGWYERRPLFGRRILVARSRAQPSLISTRLRALGADVVEEPHFISKPLARATELHAALVPAAVYDWVIFTSSAAVHAFWREAAKLELDGRAFHRARFACFGSATTRALRRRGIQPDLALRTFDPAVASQSLEAAGALQGARVLVAAEEGSPSRIAERLRAARYEVHAIPVHRVVADASDVLGLRRQLNAGEVDWVVFASSQTVKSLTDSLGAPATQVRVATIGPRTAAAARARGWPVHLVAAPQTMEALVRQILSTENSETVHAGVAARGTRLGSRT